MQAARIESLRIAMNSLGGTKEGAVQAVRPPKLAPLHPVPIWSPRVWNGMQSSHFGKLLAEYRYDVSVARLPAAYVLTIATAMPSVVNRIQAIRFGRAVAATPLVADPIFVIGHWRTGTTLLHELLSLDPQFASPTTFQCFMPRGFLATQDWLRPLTARLIPERRPMDNMAMGWDVPQEDEFALLSMGVPTPYRRMAFPNHTPRHLDYLNMNGIPARELAKWKSALREFMMNLNYHYRRQIVLKSPPHTGRVSVLLDLCPKAKFIHIHRSPFEFIPSTMHMWASLDCANAFQIPTHEGLESYVFDSFQRLYAGFFRDRHLLTPENYFEIRYQDLARDSVESMRALYESLRLGDYSQVEGAIRARAMKDRSYVRNKHDLPKSIRSKIEDHCGQYMRSLGYCRESAAA